MKSLLKKNKGQVLLFVFILLILTSILVTGIANLWESGLQLNRSQLESLVAFYMAQSGLQRAAVDLAGYDKANDYSGCPLTSLGIGNYVVTKSTQGNRIKFTSVGRCGNAERAVSFTLPKNAPNGLAYGFWRHFEDTWTEE